MSLDADKVLVWVHGDCLDPRSPALTAYPDAPAVFVFDEEVLAFYELSAKRLVFLYESLLEVPNLRICRGDVADQIGLVAAELGREKVATVEAIAPRFSLICNKLRRQKKLPVELFQVAPFIELPPAVESRLDLKRFSRYWQVASKYLS